MDKIRPNALVIVQKNDYLLVEKGEDEVTCQIFYRLLGGGIEFGELSNETIKRELKEELNAEIINEKFLCSIENRFELNSRKYHEITFLYSGDFKKESLYNEKFIKILDKEDKNAEWVSITEVKNGNIILYPRDAVVYL